MLLRDLGGFSYEVHRAGGAPHGGHRDIIERKAQRLAAIDEELRAHEAALGLTAPAQTVVREPGIGGTCPACGELHGSDAGWCAYCGTPLTERARRHAEDGDGPRDRRPPGRRGRARRGRRSRRPGRRARRPSPRSPRTSTSARWRSTRASTVRSPSPAKPAEDQPTSELTEPVTSERRP